MSSAKAERAYHEAAARRLAQLEELAATPNTHVMQWKYDDEIPPPPPDVIPYSRLPEVAFAISQASINRADGETDAVVWQRLRKEKRDVYDAFRKSFPRCTSEMLDAKTPNEKRVLWLKLMALRAQWLNEEISEYTYTQRSHNEIWKVMLPQSVIDKMRNNPPARQDGAVVKRGA